MITQLQQNRRIIQDFTLTTLVAIPGEFGRLTYIASLRDLSSGKYEHAGLAVLYPDEAVQQALELCHEQIFERVLETSLAKQEADLKECLERMPGGLCSTLAHWRRMEAYRVLMPDALLVTSRSFSVRIYARCWSFSRKNVPRLRQPGNHSHYAANHFGFFRKMPNLGHAAR